MGVCTQYCALLRKNFVLKRRQWVSTLFELCLPAIVFLVLVIVKELLPPTTKPASLQLDKAIQFEQTSRAAQLSQILDARGTVLAFYPPDKTKPIMDYLKSEGFSDSQMMTFDDAEQLLAYTQNDDYGQKTIGLHAALEVTDLTGPNYKYALRFNTTSDSLNQSTLKTTLPAYSLYDAKYSSDWKVFDKLGFTLFQDLVDTYILNKEGIYTWPDGYTMPGYDDHIRTTFQPMPTREYIVDDFSDVIGSTLGFILTLIFIWPLTRIISSLVEEKELKLKASMQLMGLGQASLFFSWLTTYSIIFAIISVLLCLCSFWGIYSNSFIIFIFFLYFIFGLTVFALGYLISAFFDNAKTASTFGSILFLLTFFVSFVTEGEGTSAGAKLGVCFIPTACLSQTGAIISKLEGLGIGVTRQTVNETINNFTVAKGIGMLLVDLIILILLGVYFNQITKSHFGISQPWYFLCKPSFWCGTKYSRKGSPCGSCCTELPSDRTLPPFDPSTTNEDFTMIQTPLQSDEPIIQIRDLRKTFPGTSGEKKCCGKYPDFVAVKGTSIDMYKGQIFVLLGENGAGKSTLFNMLTGLLAPTSGEALVNGYSINKDIQQIYQQQGVCFQHDVLYPNLTVYEHMRLFAAIKEMDMSIVHDEIVQLLDTVGLGPKGDNKLDSLSSTLSGGQKRKLSVAISLLNDPKVLFLDELSTGVDVHSVRALWKVLLDAREGRVIVMTTHDMSEASAISDRIGIVAAGKLMCSGSNLFLKDKYGVGYTLTVNKVTEIDTATDHLYQDDIEATSPAPDTPAPNYPQHDDRTDTEKAVSVSTRSGKVIYDYIIQRYPFAILSNDSAGEIAFRLPLSASPHFPQMLDALDADKDRLGISTYGLGVTSLTEVFLRVISGQSREELHKEEDKQDQAELSPKERKENNKRLIDETWGQTANAIKELSSSQIFWRHFSALYIKRFHNFRRDGKAALWTLLYPGVILLAGLLALKFTINSEYPRRDMSPNLFPADTQFVIGNPFSTNPLINNIHTTIRGIAPAYSSSIVDSTTTNATIPGFQQWLFDGYNTRPFDQARFGGLLLTEAFNVPSTDAALSPEITMSLHLNVSASDSLPAYTNFMNNALLATVNPDANIEMESAPLPRTKRLLTFINSTTAFILAIAMSFVPASYAAYVVRERQDQVKHLQMVSGVSNLAYWLSNLAFDISNFVLPFLLVILILFSFNIEPIMEPSGIILVIVSLWLFVLASCPFTYAISFLFDSFTTAQNMTLLLNFLTSVVLLVLSFLLTMIESTRSANKILRFFYRLLPGYTLGDTFMMLLIRKQIYPESKSAWELTIAGWNLIFFVFDAIIYTALIILFEHWSSNNTLEWIKGGCTSIAATDDEKFRDPDEDIDVKDLRTSIEQGKCDNAEEYPIVLKGLRKVYPSTTGEPFMAVSNVFLNVKKGQTLGLLGANGAGKSTTMKLLTSDIYPSEGSGDAVLGGLSLLHQSERIRHLLGYCPQFDALLPLLTARQHLVMYASIKCVPKDKIDGYVNFMLKKLGLSHLADRPAGTYSGGNKRKLSLGLSIIGNPLILLLDEVSSGVDPSSRRVLWDLISSTMENRSIILVSHSLEEIEALSSKIAIFASGRIRAYGSSLHLKQRHGNGLQVELQCNEGQQDAVKDWFAKTFSEDLIIVEQHRVTLKYAIPKAHYNLTEVFRIMENAKTNNIGIESYSVSETSLDQIFIKFIREDDERRLNRGGQRT